MQQVTYRDIANVCKAVDADQRANVQSALARNLPEFQPALFGHDGTFVVVGSGPSMPLYLDDIRQERERGRPIVAIKGAHDWLVSNGIEPDVFVCVDPRDRRNGIQRKNARTLYMIASRCDPVMFDHLADCKVMVWHSWSEEEDLPELRPHTRIGGGSTSGLRAINIGHCMGFRRFVLYGFDSCLADDGKTKRFTGEEAPADAIMDLVIGGRRFLCNAALAMQASEFQELYKVMPGIKIDVKGDGAIAAIVAERRKRGLPA
jgi:uncharacterized Rossmann fold enzyme